MAKFSVAVSDSVFPNLDLAREVLSPIGAELRLASEPVSEKIMEVAREADALLVTYAKITGEMIRQLKRCRIISRFGIGVDNVDLSAATSARIFVTKVPDYCVDEVSDHTMALLLALIRKVPFADSLVQSGRWEMPAVVPIHRIRGKILGLVGFGKIPQLVAPKAKAFGLKIVAYDPYASADLMKQAGVEKVEFAELLQKSDYVSVHAPLSTETRNLLNAAAFERMKSTAYLVNTARGPLIDEAALARALDSGLLAGAALDVMVDEPPKNSPLFGRPNVIVTPHTSFYSVEALGELQTKAAEEVVRVLQNKRPLAPVNPELLDAGAAV
jgi:D-3-phosphoglycerate dehydrogenase / 2-oxoglutarate reductase